MAAETGFIIDDVRHDVPTLDTFTMDEAQVLYDYCGLTIEDFAPLAVADTDEDDEATASLNEKLRNPGFLRALMHVAYQRANPRLSAQKVKTVIGSADLLGNFAAFLEINASDDEDADAVPPASTTEPETSSSKSSVDSNESSGTDSEKSSDGPVVQLAPISTDESSTSTTFSQASSAT